MISKVIEEALENMVRRIEVIESKLSKLSIPDKKGFHKPTNPGLASQGQTKYIRILGGDPWPEMTKAEAGKEIDRLLQIKKDGEIEKNCESIVEPKEVDTEDAGLDEEDLM